jgi:hypothetical protein
VTQKLDLLKQALIAPKSTFPGSTVYAQAAFMASSLVDA